MEETVKYVRLDKGNSTFDKYLSSDKKREESDKFQEFRWFFCLYVYWSTLIISQLTLAFLQKSN